LYAVYDFFYSFLIFSKILEPIATSLRRVINMIPTRLVAIQNLRFVRNPCICFWLLGLITIQKLLLVLYAEFNAIFILYISFLSLIMLEFDCNLHSFLAYGFFYSSSLYSLIYFPYILVTFFLLYFQAVRSFIILALHLVDLTFTFICHSAFVCGSYSPYIYLYQQPFP